MSLLVLTSEGNGTDGDGGASRATLAVVAEVVSSISTHLRVSAPYNRSFASHVVHPNSTYLPTYDLGNTPFSTVLALSHQQSTTSSPIFYQNF
jgi:hypothetical protein